MQNYQLAKLVDYNGNLDKRWFVEYKFLHPETKEYKRFRLWISERLLTKQERYVRASQIKQEINQQLKSGFDPFAPKERHLKVREAVEGMVELKKKTCRRKSWISYKSMTGKFLEWIDQSGYSEMYAKDLTEQIAFAFLDQLLTTKNLNNCTHNCYLICMKTIFNDLKRRKVIISNPFEIIQRLPVEEPELVVFSERERREIKQKLPQTHYRLYCVGMMIYYCFLRPAEIMRLQIKDLNFYNRSILVNGNKSKNKKRFYVTMPPALIDILLDLHLEKYNPELYIFGKRSSLDPDVKQISPTRISELWNKHVKKGLGIKKSIYDLKHNGNGAALESGIDIRQIQLQNRHHSLEQTQIYLNKFNNRPGEGFADKMPDF